MMDLADCNEQRPWVTTVHGPQADEDRDGLIFSAEFPCGVETDATGEAVNMQPLVELDAATGCVGGLCPGDMVLVRGHVQARNRVAGVGRERFQSIPGCEGVSAHPRIKLAVRSCGWRGPIIIDSDSAVVVPAGQVDIQVLGPNNWSRGAIDVDVPEQAWTDVSVRVSVCPTTCCSWEGVLTEYATIDVADPTPLMLVRPRRADALIISAATAVGGPMNATVIWLPDVDAPVTDNLGATTFQSTFPVLYSPVGAAAALTVAPAAGIARMSARWRIR
jgi:hypothetical protein